MEVSNLLADISDGNGFFSGHVSNISRRGMLLHDIPQKLDDQAKKLSLGISGNGGNFKMQSIPKWASGDGLGKKLGIELVNIPHNWTQFVMELEARPVDAWGYMSL
jgi:hypothetical protein